MKSREHRVLKINIKRGASGQGSGSSREAEVTCLDLLIGEVI